MKQLLRRVGFVTALAALLSASGCSLLQPGAKAAGTSHPARKSKKTPADSIPNASDVGL